MFWGEPFYGHCHYEGPNLMWMWHHGIGLHILVRDTTSNELRVIEANDSPEFNNHEGVSKEQRETRSTEYVNKVVCAQMARTEERIEQSQIARWEFETHGVTDIPCPRCGMMLNWRDTGIS